MNSTEHSKLMQQFLRVGGAQAQQRLMDQNCNRELRVTKICLSVLAAVTATAVVGGLGMMALQGPLSLSADLVRDAAMTALAGAALQAVGLVIWAKARHRVDTKFLEDARALRTSEG